MKTRTTTRFALCAAALAGCGEEVTRYAPLDASAWDAPAASWEVPDGGAAGYGFVSNSLMNSVSVLDLASRRTIATLPVGVVPLTENGPHHLAIDRAANAIFMPLSMPPAAIPSGPHAAHGSSTRPGVLIKRALDDFRLLGRVDVDANPGDMLLSPDRRRIFVSHFDLVRAQNNINNREAQRSNLLVVDARTMERTLSIPVCVAAHGMVVSPDGNTVYMACYGDDALGVVSLATTPPTVRLVPINGQLSTTPTSPTYGPYAVTPSPDGSTVWVSCSPPDPSAGNRGLLIAFDTRTGAFDTARVTRSLIGTPLFGAYSPDGATMVIPLQGRDALARVTTSAPLRVMEQVPVSSAECVLPHQVSLGPDGRYYLVCEGVHDRIRQERGSVLALSPDDLSVVARYEVGVFPDAIYFLGAPR